VLGSGFQSIDMPCIVLPVKFDGGLFISFLRTKQLFTKKRVFKTDQFSASSNFQTFQNPPFEKSLTFFWSGLGAPGDLYRYI
jgi:hypothetical protein